MRCPECRRNHQKKFGQRCECGYEFVFNPAADGITDGTFVHAIRSAGGNGTSYFTAESLYTAYCRHVNRFPKKRLAAFVVFLLLAVALRLFAPRSLDLLTFIAIVGTAFSFIAFLAGYPFRVLGRTQFDQAVSRWQWQEPPLEKFISSPGLDSPPPRYSEPDIYDYGVERVLVVERDILVDLFVRNDFHAQERALIISVGGYPRYLLPVAEKLLKESPGLPAFFLHDSTAEGCRMGKKHLDVMGNHLFLDIGITGEDVKAIPSLKPLKASRQNFGVAVDAVPYTLLAALVSEAMSRGVTVGVVLADGGPGPGDGGSG